jgi:hypothetical protein
MYHHRNGIRGPTGPDKANDRAGNAAVRQVDRGGSGTNQPGRVSRNVCLAPAASVGGRGADVKVGARGQRVPAMPCSGRRLLLDTKKVGHQR